MLLLMAFKNIFRNKKRTIITLIAVFAGVFLMVAANGFNKGLKWQIGNLFIKTQTGSLQVVAGNYIVDDLENPLDYPLKNYREIVEQIETIPEVQAYSPRISFNGSLTNGIDEVRARGIGVNPSDEDKVFSRSAGMVQGRFFQSEEEGIVIGEDLAELLDLQVGDYVTVIARASEMGFNAYDLEVTGFIRTGNPVLDGGAFFIPMTLAKDFLSFPFVTELAVALKNNNQIDMVAHKILEQISEDCTILTWRDFAEDFTKLVEFRGRMIRILTTMILLMAAAGIMNTMLMAMMERTREIGNLKALGLRRSEIILLFLSEGALIGLLGSLLGAILGGLVIYYFQVKGIPLGMEAINKMGNIPIAGKLYTYLDFKETIYYFTIGFFVATVATVYPAIKSAALRPVKAIRMKRG